MNATFDLRKVSRADLITDTIEANQLAEHNFLRIDRIVLQIIRQILERTGKRLTACATTSITRVHIAIHLLQVKLLEASRRGIAVAVVAIALFY